jgi:predicted lipid-binding transport protein (Tim44 family)
MAGYFQEELNENARKGVCEAISGVKLLQGDLAEAWREGPTDYATVAMRYAITEQVIERTSGKAVTGEPEKTDEVTEVWTFRRDNGASWKLSAIQQVDHFPCGRDTGWRVLLLQAEPTVPTSTLP